jgi:hypothetical protein
MEITIGNTLIGTLDRQTRTINDKQTLVKSIDFGFQKIVSDFVSKNVLSYDSKREYSLHPVVSPDGVITCDVSSSIVNRVDGKFVSSDERGERWTTEPDALIDILESKVNAISSALGNSREVAAQIVGKFEDIQVNDFVYCMNALSALGSVGALQAFMTGRRQLSLQDLMLFVKIEFPSEYCPVDKLYTHFTNKAGQTRYCIIDPFGREHMMNGVRVRGIRTSDRITVAYW